MCCRISWNTIRALKNLSKNIFYFTALIFKGPCFNHALELVLLLDLVDSPKYDIKRFHLLEERVSLPLLGGREQSSLFQCFMALSS